MKTFTLIATLLISAGSLVAQERVRPAVQGVKPIRLENTRTSTSQPAPAIDQTVYTGVKGTVRVSTNCGTYIEVTEKGAPAKYYPLNLPTEFAKDGEQILFDYAQEADKFPSDCGFTKAVSLNNVRKQQVRAANQ